MLFLLRVNRFDIGRQLHVDPIYIQELFALKISTKGRYALRMMVDIAEHQKDGYVTLKDVALHQGISKKYLEQIALHLSQAGMLRAVRGYQGGYMLSKAPGEYTVFSVLQVVEGSMVPVSCMEQTPIGCERCDMCKTLPVWMGLEKLVRNYLSGITLEDVMEGRVNAD